MKKLLSVLLAVSLLFAVSVPAFAVINQDAPAPDAEGKQSESARVYTNIENVPETYKVSIPAETPITWGETSTPLYYKVESQLKSGRSLSVTIVGTNAQANGKNTLKLVDGDKTIPYTFSRGEGAATEENLTALSYTPNVEVLSTQNRSFNVDVATADWDAAALGTYEDYLTFTVEIVPIV